MDRFAVLALSFLVYEQTVSAATIDQRQNGDLNVQIDLKNLKIVGLMKSKEEEYVDYDYAYDYAEMTIRPSSGTTKKPINVTESPNDKNNTTASTTGLGEQENSTSNNIHNNTSSSNTTDVTTQQTINDSTVTESDERYKTTISAQNLTLLGLDLSTQKTEFTDSSIITPLPLESVSYNSSHCKKGFFRNSKGNCELKLQHPSNALLNMLKQKSKLGNNTSESRL